MFKFVYKNMIDDFEVNEPIDISNLHQILVDKGALKTLNIRKQL